MDRGTAGVGILVGLGLIVHGFLSLVQCSGKTGLEYIVMDCGANRIRRASRKRKAKRVASGSFGFFTRNDANYLRN